MTFHLDHLSTLFPPLLPIILQLIGVSAACHNLWENIFYKKKFLPQMSSYLGQFRLKTPQVGAPSLCHLGLAVGAPHVRHQLVKPPQLALRQRRGADVLQQLQLPFNIRIDRRNDKFSAQFEIVYFY